ncbi:hypothetical protein [Clostridioides sp. ZZV15-6598]
MHSVFNKITITILNPIEEVQVKDCQNCPAGTRILISSCTKDDE